MSFLNQILGGLGADGLGGVQNLGMGVFPQMLQKFQGQPNMFPGHQVDPQALAMQGGGMPDLMNPNPSNTIAHLPANFSGLGRAAPLSFNPWEAGLMPKTYNLDQNQMDAMMGLAALGREEPRPQQTLRASGAGLASGQFRPYTPTPGARFLGR